MALWACYFIGCLAGLMAIGIAKPVGVDIGVEAGLATMLVGVFAVFNGFGRPVFGALTDKLTPGIPRWCRSYSSHWHHYLSGRSHQYQYTFSPLQFCGVASVAGWPSHDGNGKLFWNL